MSTERWKPFCFFHVYGDVLDPDEVERCLGISPDGSGRRGEERGTGDGRQERTIKTGYWMVDSSRHIASTNLNEHLTWIMNRIDAKKLRGIQSVERRHLSIVTVTDYPIGEILVPARFVEFAASLGAEISTSVEFDNSDESDPATTPD